MQLRDKLRTRMFGVDVPPQRIGRYVVLETLGVGGMGVVYAAHDPDLDRRVALKLLHESSKGDTSYRGRLSREARALARLSHPNVVQVFEIGWHEDRIFLAMEYIDGPTLREWLTDTEHSWSEIVEKFVQAGRGLEAAHRYGIVHRDLKPANLLVGPDGRVRVLDFGLARTLGDDAGSRPSGDETRPAISETLQSLTQTGEIIGTPAYMSPEQIGHKVVDARSDQFSFCVALFEALHGERPHPGTSVTELLLAVREGRRRSPVARRSVPRRITRAVDRGLQTSPDDRFGSMQALLDQLEPVRRSRRGLVAVGAAAALTAVFVAAPNGAGDSCEDMGLALEGIWDPTRRGLVASSLQGGSPVAGRETAAAVTQQLDDYAAAWVTARTRSCLAAVQSTDVAPHDVRLACLERRRRSLAALVERLVSTRADPAAMERAPRAVGTLPRVGGCEDPARLLQSTDAPPRELEEVVADIRRELDAANASAALGRQEAAIEAATLAITRARQTEYGPILAEALLTAGRAHAEVFAVDLAEAELLESAALSEANRQDGVAADAWIDLVQVRGRLPRRLTETLAAARHAEASIGRLGKDPHRRAALLHKLGYAYLEAGEIEEAQVAYRDSVALRRGAPDSDALEAAWTEVMYADALAAGGRDAEAAVLFSAALETVGRRLGPDHPTYAKAVLVRGLAHLEAGAFAEATTDFDTALAGYERAYGPSSAPVADVLEAVAELEMRRGGTAAGLRAAERALAIRRADNGALATDLATTLGLVAELRHAAGDPAAAAPLYEQARLALTPGEPRRAFKEAALSCNQALALVEMGELGVAIPLFERSLSGFGRTDEELALAEYCGNALAEARGAGA